MTRAIKMLKCEFKHGEFPQRSQEACPAVDLRRVTALRGHDDDDDDDVCMRILKSYHADGEQACGVCLACRKGCASHPNTLSSPSSLSFPPQRH